MSKDCTLETGSGDSTEGIKVIEVLSPGMLLEDPAVGLEVL